MLSMMNDALKGECFIGEKKSLIPSEILLGSKKLQAPLIKNFTMLSGKQKLDQEVVLDPVMQHTSHMQEYLILLPILRLLSSVQIGYKDDFFIEMMNQPPVLLDSYRQKIVKAHALIKWYKYRS